MAKWASDEAGNMYAAKMMTKGREIQKQNGEAAVKLIEGAAKVNRPVKGGSRGTIVNIKA